VHATNDRGLFVLSDGRAIILQSLEQWSVYAGLLEGLPTKQINDADIKRLVEEAERRDGHPPLLIPPVQRPIAYEGRYPFGEPARLPSVGCVGRFFSHEPARDSSKDCSYLTVMWFQDEFAFPLDSEIEKALLAMDWNAAARDVEL
jgi:hypothetical protein